MTKRLLGFMKTNGAVILFFAVFLLYGLLTVKDYGISTDELIERESSLITYRYMVSSVADVVTETVNFPELTPLLEYKDRYYGMAVQIPAVVVEHLFGFHLDIRKVFLMRHLYNFLMFFAATIFFHRLCRKLGHGKWMSLLGVSILILTPRILAHAYYNIKDMMFLSVFVITLYFGFLCIEAFSWKRLVPFAFFGALCTNIRVVGAMVIAVCLVIAFVKSLFGVAWESGENRKLRANRKVRAERKSEKERTSKRERKPLIGWKRSFCYCLATAALCFGFYYIMTPIIWHDTWRQILNLMDTFSNYVVWYTRTYFMGEYILSTELPWYYLFVNIGITTPVFYLAMFVCGGAALTVRAGKGLTAGRKPEGTDWYYIGLAVNLIVPFVYVLISRPVLYNGWRHFYFVYPMMVLVMLYGIAVLGKLAWNLQRKSAQSQNVSEEAGPGQRGQESGASPQAAMEKMEIAEEENRKGQVYGRTVILKHPAALAYGGAVAAAVLSVGIWICRNHPHEYAFFNRIALPYVTEYFQKDYWNVSQYELLRSACEQDGREQIKVWVLPENAIVFQPPEHRNRIKQVVNQDDADYIVTAYTASCEEERLAQYYLYDEQKAVWVDGIKISSLFRRAYDPALRSVLEENGDVLRYNVNGVTWEMSCEGGETVLHGSSQAELVMDKLFIQGTRGTDERLMETLQVLVSEDGEHYTPLELKQEFASAENERTAVYQGQSVTDVMIRHKTVEDAAFSISLLTGRLPGEEAAASLSVIDSASASLREDQTQYAYDGNPESRWTSGTAQTEGMFYQVRLKDTITFDSLVLDSYTSTGDEGKNLVISCSDDGKQWTTIDAITQDGIHYTFAPVSCRHLRLEVGAVDAENFNNWSIHEIGFMTEVKAR